ncbi:MAG: translation elongation factor Ts [Bacilli bacterium]|nr:translation elongation factor Ts [Bacilli bacterium]MDD4548071.1 translation elongation factor Ts [Bacilli bacterium]
MMISASLVKELRELTGAGMLDCKKALEENNGDIEQAVNWLREKGISKAAKKAGRIAAEGLSATIVEGNKAVIIEVNSETDFVAKNEEFQELVQTLLNTIVASDASTLEEALTLTTNEGTVEELLVAKTSKIGEKLSFRRFELITKNDNQTFGSYVHMGGKISVLTVLENATEDVARDVAMHAAAMKPRYVRRDEVPTSEIDQEKTILREQVINEGKPENIIDKIVDGKIQKYYQEVCLEEQPFVKDGDVTVGKYVTKNGGTIVSMTRYEVGEGIEKRNEDFADEVMSQIKNA